MTASAEITSLDSLTKAFDNCVYKHDSLRHELNQCKELQKIDNGLIFEHRERIKFLNLQISELGNQIDALKEIIDKKSKDYKDLEKSAKKERRKSNFKTWLIAPASVVGGFSIGFLVAKFAK